MESICEDLKKIFQNFRWIDDIPEDQNRRDEICVEAKVGDGTERQPGSRV